MKEKVFGLEPVKKQIIWGGHRLADAFGKGEPGEQIAEAWELAVHPDGICRVRGSDMPLDEYLNITGKFPTMIKLIDAEQQLSVQVHPAKTEMWYIIDAEPGAQLVYGLKEPFDEARFRAALADGSIGELLNYTDVHPGDMFFIPSGLVHAIGAGILIAEIQQSSNTTYRVYDYGRLQNGRPRELHVDAACSVIRDFTADQISAAQFSLGGAGQPGLLAACEYFTVRRRVLEAGRTAETVIPPDGFCAFICIEGSGHVGDVPIHTGETVFADGSAEVADVVADSNMILLEASNASYPHAH